MFRIHFTVTVATVLVIVSGVVLVPNYCSLAPNDTSVAGQATQVIISDSVHLNRPGTYLLRSGQGQSPRGPGSPDPN